ncbi:MULTISPECIES: DNA translocase FtsK [Oceanobacillus]|uniref:DNA translocase FtsK n=1 Tax=Oceanobacillus aidingensis TaxID=645964 RepID=A0ABV9JZ19_9BACI|nr:DNA translocase FtsK [Oceanobacillus oncorhynchi]MDM8102412.1 DNA translocase FtsK [Oceanobacillus oncorhynchi]
MHMWWEQWKERLKNIFTKEVEIEVEEFVEVEQEESDKQPNIQTKMTYHYPSGRSFKFPVIPDTVDQKKETNVDKQPSYKRRNQDIVQERRERRTHRENNQRKETTADKKPDNHRPLPNRSRKEASYPARNARSTPQAENNPGRKVYKKNPDVPFQPTEVPSPIYGFQSRESKLIHEIPAYQRKESKLQKEDEAASSLEDTMMSTESLLRKKEEFPTIDTGHHSDRKEADIFETADPSDKQQDTFSKDMILEQTHEVQQEVSSTAEMLETEEDEVQETPPEPEEPKTETENDVTSQKRNPIHTTNQMPSQNKERSSQASTAFNVMMTPRDKKNLQEQRKREETFQRLQQAHERREDELRKAEEKLAETHATNQDSESMASTVNIVPAPVPSRSEPEPREVPLHLLNDPAAKSTEEDEEWLIEQQDLLEETLKHFQVKAKVVKATQGPSVTRFEVHPEMGVKVSKIKNLADDLKLNMSAKDIRIEAPIPGKNTVGIEVPNLHPEMVGIQRIIESDDFKDNKSPLSVALGLTIEGMPKVIDINKMPHGLIAGATGSGKSVCINTILVSLIYNASHEDVRILLIDPKMVELAPYNGIPHLVSPVITDVKAATQSLKWAVAEMEDRYDRFVNEGVRDISRYNQKMLREGKADQKMPFIVIVIDELADLMMMSPQDVEDAISRIAQKARACGIHLLLATQRPSVDVITGLIKANIPTRIAFSVSSQVDSRTIIDSSGAEKLLGKGDMLLIENGAGKSVRLQGPFVSDEEIERVANYAKSMAEPKYLFEQEDLLEQVQIDEEEDDLLEDAIEFVLNQNSASTSSLQRHFKIGYNRAARLIDSLEQRGIISGQNGSRAREVLITKAQRDSM